MEVKYIKEEIKIEGNHQKPITLDVNYIENSNPVKQKLPLIIFSHGFKGFKDWGTFNLMAERFARQNFFFVKFNFSYNGTSADNFTDLHDLEAFGNNNFEIEMDDLGTVIDWFEKKDNPLAGHFNFNELYLIGHSRGGGISMLKTVEDSRVKKVACWATVNDLEKYMHLSDAKVWKDTGVSFVENTRTGIKLPLYYQFYENYYKYQDRFNVKKNLMKLDKPLLLLHGDSDSIVEVADAEWIYGNVNHSIFINVEGGDHTFGGRHPWENNTLPEDLNFVLEETVEFFTF